MKRFSTPNNGDWYAKTLASLQKNPGCIGFHLGSTYQHNKARHRGLLDELETPDRAQIQLMNIANEKMSR